MTEVVGGPDIHVDRLSTLQLLCRVSSGNKTPAFIIWQRGDKVRLLPSLFIVLLTLRLHQGHRHWDFVLLPLEDGAGQQERNQEVIPILICPISVRYSNLQKINMIYGLNMD